MNAQVNKRYFEVNLRFNYRDTDDEWTSNLVGPIRVMALNGTEAEGIVCEKAQSLLKDIAGVRCWSGRSTGIIKAPKWGVDE